jgi:RNA polymerase sigma factor (sigma-70 family)
MDDVADLYRSLSKPLQDIVRFDVAYAPQPVIEDACQFAWIRLFHNRDRVRRETALSWLAQTAIHEAVKLLRRERRCLSLDATPPAVASPDIDDVIEYVDHLRAIYQLPERQQRLVWLYAAGLSYSEMASQEHCSRRTVDRQLMRAKRTLREAG